jgi:hypothetical protein
LNYLIPFDPISGLFPESYSYSVYVQYDMIWHANAGMSRICWSIYRMQMTGQIWSLINFGQKNTTIQIYFRFGFLILKRENQSQETVPENNLVRSVTSIAKSPVAHHDLVSCIILSVFVCRLVKIFFENLWSQNRLNWRVSYSHQVWFGQGIPDAQLKLSLFKFVF